MVAVMFRGGSSPAATSKMEHFGIIVNSSPRSASDVLAAIGNVLSLHLKSQAENQRDRNMARIN